MTDRSLFDRLGPYRVPLGLLALVVLLRPLVGHPWVLGYQQIATTMLVWMLFVAAFNLLFGFTGLLSFGHAMFLGCGLYGAAIGTTAFDLPLVVGVAVGVLLGGLSANLLGRLIVDRGEIYFAMLTLAAAQAVYFLALRDPYGLTGGSNGISQGTLPGWIETFRGQMTVTAGVVEFDWYWVVAAVFLVCMVGLWQLLRSPFGRSLIAIRENQDLARAMGIDAKRYKVASFTVSGALSAVAGSLLLITNQGAAIENLEPLTSGKAVLMAVLGGVNYFFGPVIGAFIWLFSSDYLESFETLQFPLQELTLVSVDLSGVLIYWRFLLGALFVVVVLLAPTEGAWGALRRAAGRLRRRYEEVTV